jgi:hypothetical protein
VRGETRGRGGQYHLKQMHIHLARLFPEKIAVNPLIAVFKENRFSTIATLRHVMGEIGYHHEVPNAS